MLLGVFIPHQSFAQCSLVCNPSVQVSLDANCLAHVQADDILEGSNTCVGPMLVEIYDLNGNLIPSNPFVDGTYVGQVLPVKVIDQTTGNFCESFIDIRDYIKPEITCSNINLTCNASTHPDDIGFAQVTDNCDTNPVLSFSDQLSNPDCDPNAVQIITRTWTAEDASGNTAIPCVQTITLNRPVIANIQFPANKDDVESPSLDCVNPDTSPTNTGYPTLNGFDLIDGTICELWVMYTDSDPLPGCEGTFSILRTWTINEECTNNAVSEVQLIKIKDTQGPVIDCPNDITVNATSTTCSGYAFIPQAVVSDNCSSNSNISITILDANGSSVIPNSTVYLPVGIHAFTYTATDACGNSNDCTLNVTVDDGVNPVVICNSFTTVALGSAGTTFVPGSTFDDGSYDNCGPITFLARRMDNPNCPGDDASFFDTEVPFYCCDVGDTIMVEMMVEDAINRLSNSCMVEVIVQDKLNPTITCPSDITLDCTTYILDPSVTGEPIVFDNCEVADVSYVDSTDLNICNVGMVFRTWTVEDRERG